MNALALTTGTLVRRELTRFLRQKQRWIGAMVTPLVFWAFLGLGLGESFRAPDGSTTYLQYFLPGTIALVCLFTAVFSSISVIEDRHAGFLQAVMVSPAPRAGIVLGKMLGATMLAFFQGMLFLLLVPFLRLPCTAAGVWEAALVLMTLPLGLAGLGFAVAWKTDSVQGFHAVLNLIFMPLWFLSGALFPAAGAPAWLQKVMALNPMTYGVAGLHRALFAGGDGPGIALCVGVNLAFAALAFLLALSLVSREGRG